MPPINCEINLMLTWRKDYVISSATGATTFIKYKTLRSNKNYAISRQCKAITTIKIRFYKNNQM